MIICSVPSIAPAEPEFLSRGRVSAARHERYRNQLCPPSCIAPDSCYSLIVRFLRLRFINPEPPRGIPIFMCSASTAEILVSAPCHSLGGFIEM